MGQLDGRVACLVGGDAGLRDAVAAAFGAEGATVASHEGAAADAVRATLDQHGRVDVVVVGATGTVAPVAAADLDEATLDGALDAVLRSAAGALATAVPSMVDQGSGRVIVLSSTRAKLPAAGATTEVVAAHAVQGLVKAAALDLGTTGVTVNALCPPVEGPDHESVAAAAVLLASEPGAGITGALLSVDGGISPY